MAPELGDVPESVRGYFESLEPVARRRVLELRRVLLASAPQAEEVRSYGIAALRQSKIVVYFGGFRDHCSLFLASPTVRSRFAREIRPYTTGRGTLSFPHDRPLPRSLIQRLVRARVHELSSAAAVSARTAGQARRTVRATSRFVPAAARKSKRR